MRGEYKVATFSRYLLPSMRYHMSVHTIHTTHLDKLDMSAKSYLKKWLKIPSRGVTDLTFFHPRLLDIKPPSQLYLEGHAGNYVNNRLKGDRVVNAALDSVLERESQWSRKSSTMVKCDQIFQEVAKSNHIPDPTNCIHVSTWPAPCRPSFLK